MLAELLRQAHSVTLALTYGEGAGEEAVFAPARKTLAWIKGLAAKVGCPVEEEALPAGEWERTPAPAPFGAGAFCPSHALLYRPLGR